MPIGPRLALFALLSALLLALVACGGDDGDGGAETQDARALLARALSNPPESGEMRLRIGLDLKGTNGLDGPSALTLRGPFQFRGKSALPTADWAVTAQTGALALRGRLKLIRDAAFLEFEGDDYELGELASAPPAGARKDGFLKKIGLDPASWLESPRLEDGREIGGDPTRRVTGSVNVDKVIRDGLAALRSPELRRMLGPRAERLAPPELSDTELDAVRDAITKLDFEAGVDNDDLLRRMLVKASFEVPPDAGIELEGGDVTIDYVLQKVGADVDVERPRNAQPIGQLLREFGVKDPFGLTQRQ